MDRAHRNEGIWLLYEMLSNVHNVLKVTANKRAECLTTAAEVDKLEDVFGVRNFDLNLITEVNYVTELPDM